MSGNILPLNFNNLFILMFRNKWNRKEGEEALKFLREIKRIDSLKPDDPEYRRREKFFSECEEILVKNPRLRIFK